MTEVTPDVVRRVAAGLSDDGWGYTRRQLYYAVCAALEAPRIPMAPTVMAVGGVLLLLAMITIYLAILPYALALCGALILMYGLRLRAVEHFRLHSVRSRAIGYEDFVRRFIDAPLDRMAPPLDEASLPVVNAGAAVVCVCDTAGNAAAVAEVVRHEKFRACVAVEAAPPGTVTVIAFHDASRSGCLLPLTLRSAHGEAVIEGGVRPQDVMREDLQFIEGSPGLRVDPQLGAVLTSEEVAWLMSGRRLELAALERQRLVSMVSAAIAAATEKQPV